MAGDVIDVVGLASGNFAGPATAKRQNFTATAGQTVFTVTGGYTPGQLDVFQNGTKPLNAVDVDVSNGSTFTLTTGANLNDTVEVVGFTAADTISGTLKFQDGTAAAPSITSFNDTNTGIFFPAADTIAFSEGGAESMRIDSSGNVGIGTTSPTQKLEVIGKFKSSSEGGNLIFNADSGNEWWTGAWNDLVSYQITRRNNSSGIGTSYLTISTSGNVGIGTANPAQKFVVSENGVNFATSVGGGVQYAGTTTDNSLALITNSVERLRITSGGSIFHTGTNNEGAWVQIGNGNANGYYPATGGLGCAIAWNFTAGGRENTFMNCDTSGQGFRWLQRTGTSSNSYVGSAGSNGVWYQGNNSSAWSTVSDSRIKTNIREINDAVGKIMALHPCHFEYIDKQGKTKTGFIAQEFENVFSGHIVEESYIPDQYKEYIPEGEKIKGIDLDLIPYLAKAIQELKAENDSLKARIAALEAA